MPLKTRKPITPGQRGLVLQSTDDITESRPRKKLVRPLKKTGGRNSTGKITVRHRGGVATKGDIESLISRETIMVCLE